MKAQELTFEELQTVDAGLQTRSAAGKEVLDGGTKHARRVRVTGFEEIGSPNGGLTPGGKSTS